MSWKDSFPRENIFYETENGILYNGDSIEVLKGLPDESVDLVITDPPYMISQKGKKIKRNYGHYKWRRESDIQFDFGEWDRAWETDEEFFIWVETWFKEIVRILKKGGWVYIFFNKHKMGWFDLFLGPKYGIKTRTLFVWAKSNPVPSFRKVNWLSATEFIWVGSKGNSKLKNFLYQKEMKNYMITPNGSSYKKTKHPTEKPEKLIEHLVKVNSNPDDLVLDAFAGSGTTLVACEELNRKWIGIEIEEKYCEIAKQRIGNLIP